MQGLDRVRRISLEVQVEDDDHVWKATQGRLHPLSEQASAPSASIFTKSPFKKRSFQDLSDELLFAA